MIFAQKDRQLPWMAAVILILFLFWIFVAHTMFALFLGLTPASTVAGAGTFDFLLRGNGPWLFVDRHAGRRGFCRGAVRHVGRRIAGSAGAGRRFHFGDHPQLSGLPDERLVDACLGLAITIAIAVGMATLFLGLFVVLPVLGHASWHVYRAMTE